MQTMTALQNPRIVLAFSAALVLSAAVFYALVPLTTDVSYFVMSAERMLAGDKPYVDILETNPPLAFWFTLVPVALAKTTGISPQVAYVLGMCGLIGLMLLVVWHVGRDAADRGLMVVALAVALVLSPHQGFGQREHFTAILLAPYLASVMWRGQGHAISIGLALLTGALAGVGLCFKPLFLLFPLVAEAWLWRAADRPRDIIRLQTVVMAVPVLIYPLLVWWVTPEYYSIVVPLALKTYGAYQQPLLAVVLSSAVVSFAMLFGLSVLLYRETAARAESLWLAVALAGLAIYIIQAKGWSYQLVPGLAFAAVALVRLAAQAAPSLLRRVAVAMAAVIFISNIFAFASLQRELLANGDTVFAGAPAPKVLLAMTYDNGIMFPYAQQRGIVWGSSYPALWMMTAVAKQQLTGAEAAEVTQFAARRVAADLDRYKPDQVMVDSRWDTVTLAGHKVDYLQLFSTVPEFQAAWQPYQLLRDGGTFQVYGRGGK